MAEEPVAIPKFAVAPRLVNGAKKPHIGPDHAAYHAAHGETIGEGSDEWWGKVRRRAIMRRIASD
jgi:acetyl-CoA synthetase